MIFRYMRDDTAMRILKAIRDLFIITVGTISAILYFCIILAFCANLQCVSGTFINDDIIEYTESAKDSMALDDNHGACALYAVNTRYSNLRRICDIIAAVDPGLGSKTERMITERARTIYPGSVESAMTDFETGKLPLIPLNILGGSSGTAIADFLLNPPVAGKIGLERLIEIKFMAGGGITSQELLKIIGILDESLDDKDFTTIITVFAEKLESPPASASGSGSGSDPGILSVNIKL